MIIPNSNSEPVQEVGWTDEARVAALLARRARRKKAGGEDEDVKPREREDLGGARRAGEAIRRARGREDGARRAVAGTASQDHARRQAEDQRDRARRLQQKKSGSGSKGAKKKGFTSSPEDMLKRETQETRAALTLAKREMSSIRAAINANGRATAAQLERYSELEKFMAQMRRRVVDLEKRKGKAS